MKIEHRRPRVLFALLGRWACSHRYSVGKHRQMTIVGCACDGWKPA